MSILKKATSAVKKALGGGGSKKKSRYNTGRSWSMDRIWASSEGHEQSYKSKRKKAYKTKKK
jgi:hypothetical protein